MTGSPHQNALHSALSRHLCSEHTPCWVAANHLIHGYLTELLANPTAMEEIAHAILKSDGALAYSPEEWEWSKNAALKVTEAIR